MYGIYSSNSTGRGKLGQSNTRNISEFFSNNRTDIDLKMKQVLKTLIDYLFNGTPFLSITAYTRCLKALQLPRMAPGTFF